MTFPVVQTTRKGQNNATTTHTLLMPSGIQAGDLLLVFFSTDGDNTITDSQTFTVLDQESNGTAAFGAVLYKIAAGSDTLTITTSVSEPSTFIVLRIDGWESSFAPELSTVAEGASANPNSTIVTPSWAQDDTLYIASIHVDRNRSVTFYPALYTDNQVEQQGFGSGDCSTAVASRNYNNPSDDPNVWTISASDQWIAWTIAVAPSGASLPEAGEDDIIKKLNRNLNGNINNGLN